MTKIYNTTFGKLVSKYTPYRVSKNIREIVVRAWVRFGWRDSKCCVMGQRRVDIRGLNIGFWCPLMIMDTQ